MIGKACMPIDEEELKKAASRHMPSFRVSDDEGISKICEELDTDPYELAKLCIEKDIKLNAANLHPRIHRYREILEHMYWNLGMSKTEIGEELEVSQSAITNWFNEHDLGERSGSWSENRGKVIEEFDGECYKCGCEEQIEVHHIIEKQHFDSRRKANLPANLIPLCVQCHREYKSRTPRDLFIMATSD